MGRSAMSKILEADELQKQANKLAKSDPQSSAEFRELARAKRKTAIKQMKRRPRRRRAVTR